MSGGSIGTTITALMHARNLLPHAVITHWLTHHHTEFAEEPDHHRLEGGIQCILQQLPYRVRGRVFVVGVLDFTNEALRIDG